MKYVIDIDGTICLSTDGDYENATPIKYRIDQMNKLFDEGHEIVYFTARGMGRHDNNVKGCTEEFYHMTYKQLTTWGAKYHNLIMGKPSADVYIDDKGVHADAFFDQKS